jgi:hypothetical protein
MELLRSTGYARVAPSRQFCCRLLSRAPFTVVRPPANQAASNEAHMPDEKL